MGLHLGHGCADYAEDAIEVDAQGVAPLGGGHLCDGRIVSGPDAVVGDDAVQAAEGGDSGGDECLSVFRGGERLVDGSAEVGTATFAGEGFGLLGGKAVVEGYFGSGLAEEADGGCADSSGAASDKGDLSRQ